MPVSAATSVPGAAAVPAAEATVVVCAYTERRWEDLVAGVAAARAQGPAEVLVVIDHDERLLVRARSLADERVRVVPSTRVRGLSGARNTALDLVSTEVVVFLDDDACPEPGWLAALLAPYAEEGVVAVGGAADPVWPDRRPTHLPRELDWVVGCSYTGQAPVRADVRNLMGCSMSFRTAVLRAVGGFDEGAGRVGTVPVGCEETDACIRVHQQVPGARIVLEPASRVRHRVSPDRTAWAYLRNRCRAEGQSKAYVARRVGPGDATSVERAYVRTVLPAAVGRELLRALRGDPRGLVAALAVVLALMWTTGGYLRGRLGLGGREAAQAELARTARTQDPGEPPAVGVAS